ncbi:MAG: UDP-2,3-diacylglucosamine diphosphatase LpxI [Fusobacterium perfoetens]|uniref:LpxI family protein n=1 Tax=Fusobacterium perfoetens TaxID=852 RepID=UPI0023EFC6B3|nr:UDP-2,3-diacylglucosamine diphosphatase LpxI [Fusobacterium perfoetens]MCI6151844.1 UDP-2,3-diacylglucosamine diphosphatase LpxI [Fusobacterium perfoetens]MDY3236795.1 UDP-2,3-diacylglucosamine diphosphatase LpxI [Fusobacterium perfoetens]
MEKIGVIVGNGKLPFSIMKEIEHHNNIEIFPIGLFDTVDENVKKHINFKNFNIGEVGNITKYLIKNGIFKVIMLGKVEKELIFKNIKFDKFGEELLANLPDRKDETLLFGVIAFLKLNGIKVIPQNFFLKKIMFENKCYTMIKPNSEDLYTIELGKEAAKALSEVDAGQTVICKNSSVIALEGIEGTDKTILRGGELGGENCIMVKMARPQQDMRVDIPTIGIETIKTLVKIKAKGVVGEAGKMIFTEQEEAIKLADENDIFIIGIK